MIKFVGELRSLAAPIIIYESRNQLRKLSRFSRKIVQELDTYLDIKVFFANEEKALSKYTNEDSILISIGKPPSIIADKLLKRTFILIEDNQDLDSLEGYSIAGSTLVLHSDVQIPSTHSLNNSSHLTLPLISNVIPIETIRKLDSDGPICDFGFAILGWNESEINSILARVNIISQENPSITFNFAIKPRLRINFEEQFSRNIHEEIKPKIEILALNSWSDGIHFLSQSKEIFYLTDDYCDITEILEGLAFKESVNVLSKTVTARSSLMKVCELEDSLNRFSCYKLRLKDNLKISDLSQNDFRINSKTLHDVLLSSNPAKLSRRSGLVIPADAGFFSIFNTLISIRANWIGAHLFDHLIPDWDVNRIIEFWGTSKFESFCYAGKDEGNVFFKLFESEEFASFNDYLDLKRDDALVLHSPNLSADPNLTYVWADRLYRSKGFYSWRQRMHKSLMDLQPNLEIRREIEGLISRHGNKRFIGMHVRHPSHAMEQPDKSIPDSSDYIRVTEDLLDSYHRDGQQDVLIFVATDQDSVIEEFRRVFGNQVAFFKDTNRISSQQMSEFHSLEDSMKLKSGFQVQHIAASKESNWGSGMAREVIRDTWMLSKCDFFLHSVSNIATAVSFINPEIDMLKISKGDNLQVALNRANVRIATALF